MIRRPPSGRRRKISLDLRGEISFPEAKELSMKRE